MPVSRENVGSINAIARTMSSDANSFRADKILWNFVVGLLLLWLPTEVFASQTAWLTWIASPGSNVAGYKIYYGPASHDYQNVLDVGLVTSAAISGLGDGSTNYFAATTYDSSGNESAFSNEAIFIAPLPAPPAPVITGNHPPTLNSISDIGVMENSGAQTVALSGITSGAANENQSFIVTAVSSNTKLIMDPSISYVSPKSSGVLIFKPVAKAFGTATITVTVKDSGKSNNIVTQSFNVTVMSPANVPFNTLLAAPKISNSLTNCTTLIGKSVSMSVNASGFGTLKYQWQINGTNLPSATGRILTIQNIKASQTGTYTVMVYNSAGTASTSAFVSVMATPAAILTMLPQPGGQFGFQVSGVDGYKYVVQASSDLNNWVSVTTNTSPFIFIDTNAGNYGGRFYRTFYKP